MKNFFMLAAPALLLSCLAMASGRAADTPVQIEIKTFAFSQQELTVSPGTVVTWINHDQTVHNVVAVDGKFSSPGMDTDDHFSFKFEREGDFSYLCALHPHMVGTIHVHAHVSP